MVHAALLIHFTFLQSQTNSNIALKMGVPMLLVLPLATVCLYWMLDDIKRRLDDDRELRIAATAFEMHQGLLVTDRHHVILRVNQTFCDITGYRAEDVLGKKANLLRTKKQGLEFYREVWQQLLDEGRWQGEVLSRRKNGETYPEWLSVSVVRDAKGKITHYVSAMEDISERKASEAQIRGLVLLIA